MKCPVFELRQQQHLLLYENFRAISLKRLYRISKLLHEDRQSS